MPEPVLTHILQPLTINGMTVPNRIVVPPMGMGYGSSANEVTDQLVAYHRRRAEGGMGLIVCEVTAVHPGGRCGAKQLGIYDDRFIPGFERLTRAVREHGARFALQLSHCGLRARPEYSGWDPVGPSPVPDPGVGFIPRELAIPEIQDLADAFGQAARRAKEAGFEAVEIHGAHGYLVNQFLSPWYNRRTDAYGGSFEKRLRFPLEVLERARQAVGPDYPIGFRLNGEELPLGSGLTLKDTSRIAVSLQQAGIDMIHVSVGNVGPSLPLVVPPGSIDRGFNVYAASAIKRVVDIPVIAVGRITDVRLADKIVRHGHADLVAMGRASLADPDFVRKAFEGRFDEILMCLGCTDDCTRPYRYCSTNPELGRESKWNLRPARKRKTVWVVGGGVAGVEAAVLAARRGHRVTLFEQKEELGGQIHAASAPPHKSEFVNALTNRLPLLEKYRVDVRLGTRVTVEMVRQGNPDAVVLATGALPERPPILGVDRPEVVHARDVLEGDAFVGHRVAVLGGGEVGAETAEHLAHYHREVTLIEMLDTIAGDMPQAPRAYLMHRLCRLGVTIITGAKVESITDHGVVVSIDGLKQLVDGFASIVLATGSVSDNELAEELRGVVKELYVVGDARQVSRIADATAQAAEVALEL